jgi:hypothetical protein
MKKEKIKKFIHRLHVEGDRRRAQYKSLVAQHLRSKYITKKTFREISAKRLPTVCNRFKRIQAVSHVPMSQLTGDKNYARA